MCDPTRHFFPRPAVARVDETDETAETRARERDAIVVVVVVVVVSARLVVARPFVHRT